jgi:RNA polymerase-binding transcription factor DksA
MPRKSIIPYTTTCAYCGHRVLPGNLDKHVQSQHPDHAEEERLSKQIVKKGITTCPYCDQELNIDDLEEHIGRAHPYKQSLANRIVDEKLRREKAEHLARRRRIRAKIMGQDDHLKNLEKHMQKVYGDDRQSITPGEKAGNSSHSVPRAKNKVKTVVVNYVYCKLCNMVVDQRKLAAHNRAYHSNRR